jgi:glycosyltransferase involved in cell wall biosynthesis
MRILFLDQFGEVAGAQGAMLDLLPAVRQRGWKAHVAAPAGGPLLEAARRWGATAQAIRCGPYRSGGKSILDCLRFAGDFIRLRREIAEIAERFRADLIYVNGPRVLPAAAWAGRGRLPLLFHCHSHLSQRYSSVLVGRSLRRANAGTIACCEFVAEALRPYVTPRIIYCGTRDCAAQRTAQRWRRTWRIGVVGRIAPQKGQAEFVRAARIVLRSVANCEFVVCGAPLFSTPRYLEHVSRLALGLPVTFLPWQDEVSGVLANLDLLVVPSTVPEAAPKAILEAYSAGVPVVAVRSGGIPELVSHGATGFLADSANPEALAATLLELLDRGRDGLESVARNARAVWRERYTLPRYQQEVLSFVEQFVRQTARAAA